MGDIRILDCENDARSCNDNWDWDTVAECMEDLKRGLLGTCETTDYMPWRIVNYTSADSPELMPTLVRITGARCSITFDKVHEPDAEYELPAYNPEGNPDNKFLTDMLDKGATVIDSSGVHHGDKVYRVIK